jgi:hypothetical protein
MGARLIETWRHRLRSGGYRTTNPSNPATPLLTWLSYSGGSRTAGPADLRPDGSVDGQADPCQLRNRLRARAETAPTWRDMMFVIP